MGTRGGLGRGDGGGKVASHAGPSGSEASSALGDGQALHLDSYLWHTAADSVTRKWCVSGFGKVVALLTSGSGLPRPTVSSSLPCLSRPSTGQEKEKMTEGSPGRAAPMGTSSPPSPFRA